jgi:flagella basal body P-ring formation protein FlgA
VSGSAYVSFEGVALSGGRVGDTIPLRNPAGGRTFRGIIQAKGKVLIEAGGPA